MNPFKNESTDEKQQCSEPTITPFAQHTNYITSGIIVDKYCNGLSIEMAKKWADQFALVVLDP